MKFFRKSYTMKFFFKSGQTIWFHNIRDYSVTHEKGKPTAFTMTWNNPAEAQGVFIDLREVEAIVVVRQ